MQVKSIAECSNRSILQYFGPSLSYHFPLRPLFCLFLSGRLRPVLLYLSYYVLGHTSNVHAKLSSPEKGLNFILSLHLLPYFVCVDSDGYSKESNQLPDATLQHLCYSLVTNVIT